MENQAGLLHVVFSALVSNPDLVVYLQGNFKEKLEGISKLSGPARLLPSSFRRLFKWKKKKSIGTSENVSESSFKRMSVY